VKLRLFEFFSSIGNALLVSEVSEGSIEEFSLTNDADLYDKNKDIFLKIYSIYFCKVHVSVSDVFLKFFNGN
jgi:hypothetical protein